MAFKQCLIGIKRPKVCQETFPIWRHHHQHWPKLLTKDKFGSTDSNRWLQILNLPFAFTTEINKHQANIFPMLQHISKASTYFQCFKLPSFRNCAHTWSSAVVAPPPQDLIGSYRVILRLRCFSDSGVRRVIIWVTIGFLSVFDPKIYGAFHRNLNDLFLWHVFFQTFVFCVNPETHSIYAFTMFSGGYDWSIFFPLYLSYIVYISYNLVIYKIEMG